MTEAREMTEAEHIQYLLTENRNLAGQLGRMTVSRDQAEAALKAQTLAWEELKLKLADTKHRLVTTERSLGEANREVESLKTAMQSVSDFHALGTTDQEIAKARVQYELAAARIDMANYRHRGMRLLSQFEPVAGAKMDRQHVRAVVNYIFSNIPIPPAESK